VPHLQGCALFTLSLLATLGVACSEPETKGDTLDAPASSAVDERDDPARVASDGAGVEDGASGDPEGNPEVEAEPEPEPEFVLPTEPMRVLIVGDSLAATGFGALLEDKLDAHPLVTCYRKGKSSSGLARPDFYDWQDQASRQVEFRKPDLVIVLIGGNDGQDIPPWKGSKRVQWGSDGWPAAYRVRVDDMLTRVSTPQPDSDGVTPELGAEVVWLGLPVMGMRSFERKLVLIREVQEQAVADFPRARYLATNDYLLDEDGAMLVRAEVDGKVQALRAEDRIHFSMPGSEFLSARIYPEILATLHLPETLPEPEPEPAEAPADDSTPTPSPTPSPSPSPTAEAQPQG